MEVIAFDYNRYVFAVGTTAAKLSRTRTVDNAERSYGFLANSVFLSDRGSFNS